MSFCSGFSVDFKNCSMLTSSWPLRNICGSVSRFPYFFQKGQIEVFLPIFLTHSTQSGTILVAFPWSLSTRSMWLLRWGDHLLRHIPLWGECTSYISSLNISLFHLKVTLTYSRHQYSLSPTRSFFQGVLVTSLTWCELIGSFHSATLIKYYAPPLYGAHGLVCLNPLPFYNCLFHCEICFLICLTTSAFCLGLSSISEFSYFALLS